MFKIDNIILVEDEEKVDNGFVKEKRIGRYTKRIGDTVYISFVGLILNREDLIISVPKHFYELSDFSSNSELTKEQIILDIQKLLEIILKGESSFDGSKEQNFPIDSYMTIQSFYRKFGLYTKKHKLEYTGYCGKINWKNTIKKSNKVIQENGIVFFPFHLEKNIDVNNFISECMEFVLGYTYLKFSSFFDFLLPYKFQVRNPIFNDFKFCSIELQKIKVRYFKDIEKSLIDALISFFTWLSISDDKIIIATKNFELYWEALVDIWLNKKFEAVLPNGGIITGENKKYTFLFKDELRKVEDKYLLNIQRRKGFSIQFDHYSDDENQTFLFDSKYTKKDQMSGLNYKQAFYHYYLSTIFPNKKIINGLILPTSSTYSHYIHVDRATKVVFDTNNFNLYTTDSHFIDGLKIIEHKVNLKEVIQLGARYIEDLKSNILKFK